MRKRIPISQLRPGMYLVGIDRPWLKTPFFFHKRWIKREREIELLKQHGVCEVFIDPARSKDVGGSQEEPSLALGSEESKTAEMAPSPPLEDLRQMERQELEAYLQSSEHFPRKADLLQLARCYQVPVNDRTPRDEIVRLCMRMIHDIPKGFAALRSLSNELPLARVARAEARATVQSLFEGVRTGARIESPMVRKTVVDLMDSILRCQEAFLTLVQMRRFDSDLFSHCVDVCVLALVIGKEQGLDPETLMVLGMGGLLHDVGQMRLPRNLLRKLEAHSEQERKLMQEHPRLGAVLVSQAGSIPGEVRRIVQEHHERMDGSGYPAGLKGEEIFLLSQIVSIADVYETMLGSRRGGQALLPTQALRQLYQLSQTGKLSQEWVERTIRSLGVYPVGSLVELNSGERGIVIATHPTDTLRPVVRLITQASGEPYREPVVVNLSLTFEEGGSQRTIVRALDAAQEHINLARYLEEEGGYVGLKEGRPSA